LRGALSHIVCSHESLLWVLKAVAFFLRDNNLKYIYLSIYL
jgi:hypothetical protein